MGGDRAHYALELIQCLPEVKPAMEFIFGGTVVCEVGMSNVLPVSGVLCCAVLCCVVALCSCAVDLR